MAPPSPIIQVRTISGRGEFRLDDGFLNCRRILLYSDLLREPRNRYLNKNWSPDQGQYANVTLCRDDCVGLSLTQKYESQVFVLHENDAHQVGASLVCALDNILDSFVQYAIAQGIPYSKNNSITEFGYSSFLWNVVRFDCYSSGALSLRIVGEPLEKCDPADAPPRFPPPPPLPPPRIPPDESLGGDNPPLSPPYGVSPPDQESPFPGDEQEEGLPTGELCQTLLVTGTLFNVNGLGTESSPIVAVILGVFESFELEPIVSSSGTPLAKLIFVSGGSPGSTCVQGTRVEVLSGFSRDASFQLDSVQPV